MVTFNSHQQPPKPLSYQPNEGSFRLPMDQSIQASVASESSSFLSQLLNLLQLLINLLEAPTLIGRRIQKWSHIEPIIIWADSSSWDTRLVRDTPANSPVRGFSLNIGIGHSGISANVN